MEHFDQFLKELSDQLTIKNVDEAKFLYRKKFPVGLAENIQDSLSFLTAMERVELINERDISQLYKLCDLLPRIDLIPALDKYSSIIVETKSPTESEVETEFEFENCTNLPSRISAISLGINNGLNVSNGHITVGCETNGHVANGHNEINDNFDETEGAATFCIPHNDVVSFGLPDRELQDSLSNLLYMNDEKPEEYDMKKYIHGQCMIFNNRFDDPVKLSNGKRLKERLGTERDVESLIETFTWLGFEVSVSENKSAKDIIEILTMIASQDDQADYECFVCCILSHGFDGGIYGNDGTILKTEELKSVFDGKKAFYLFGKPKLFFIQACQGDQDGRGINLEADSPIAQDHLDSQPAKTIATDADLLFFMATTSGKISWRSTEEGTWFIQTLCRVLQEKAFSWSLLDMLLKVNYEIAGKTEITPEGGDAKQMSDIGQITLRKKLYFNPPNQYSKTTFL